MSLASTRRCRSEHHNREGIGNTRNSFVYAIFKGPKEPDLGLMRGMMSMIVPDLKYFASAYARALVKCNLKPRKCLPAP